MRHIFFLSYASNNADSQLIGFFRDLCREIAPDTPWRKDDDRIAFRDRVSLELGENWKPELRDAIESSSVLVCLTSRAYSESSFCGKEFYIFQKRIEAYSGQAGLTPPVILPVIWRPHNMQEAMEGVVWKDETLPAEYESLGLRQLRFLKRDQYNKALAAIAQATVKAWKKREGQVERPSGVVQDFDEVPNAFGGDEWMDAVENGRYIPGPRVANVVYGAGTRKTVALERYGERPREWKPYLPPVAQTVGDLTRTVVYGQGLKYREIPVDKNLSMELKQAQGRKNLILVVADAASLSNEPNPELKAYDPLKPEGTALLMPWREMPESQWENESLKQNIRQIFPVKSQTPECFRAPILSVDKMRTTLETTLVEMRASLTKSEAGGKKINDEPPPSVSGAV
jgi:FxsC-like protein